MKSDYTNYEIRVANKSYIRYIAGLFVRWINYKRNERIIRIARKNGATIGEGVVMPIELARMANHNLHIGNHTSIATSKFSSMSDPIYIGDNVIIGADVNITMGSHNIDSPEFERIRPNKSLTIGDYVWLCPECTILPSCSIIGYGAVVGAKSVVVKDVEEMAVVSGFPAKELRKRKCVHSNLVVESLLGGDYKIFKNTRSNVNKCAR